MAIDRLYYFCVTVFTVTFCYTTHYQNWDGRKEGGTVGNIWRYSVGRRGAHSATVKQPELANSTTFCTLEMEQSEKTSSARATGSSSENPQQQDMEMLDTPQSHSQPTNNPQPPPTLLTQAQPNGMSPSQDTQAIRAHSPVTITGLTVLTQGLGIGLGLTMANAEPASAGSAAQGTAEDHLPATAPTAPTGVTETPSAQTGQSAAQAVALHQLATPPTTLSSTHTHTHPSSQHAIAATTTTPSSALLPATAPMLYHNVAQAQVAPNLASSAAPLSAPIVPLPPSTLSATALQWPMSASMNITGLPPPRSAGGRPMLSPATFPMDTVMAEQAEMAVQHRAFIQKSVAQVADNVVAATLAGDGASLTNDTENVALDPSSETKPKLGGLHKRRMTTSPEKFNTGQFEPMPIKTNTDTAPMKRAKLTISNTEKVLELMNKKSSSTGTGQEPQDYSFSILTALFKHQEILLHMVSFLNVPSLISLYTISKAFHYLFNSCPTAFILSLSRVIAPGAERIFPWCNYKSLCINDPSLKTKSKYAGLDKVPEHMLIRDAPSLRWLQMVVWREGVCRDIVIQLTLQGLRVPHPCVDALKRMWFLMDLPLNSHRIALLRNRNYFTNCHIFLLTLFFLKLDMAFTSPTAPLYPRGHSNQFLYPNHLEDCTFIGVNLRETLLAERNLSSLWRVLHGWSPDAKYLQTPFSRGDILRLQVRHHFRFPDGVAADSKARTLPILGVPAEEVGMAGMERINKAPGHTAPQHLNAPFVPGPSPSTAGTPTPAGRLYPHATPVHINVPNARPAPIPLLRPDQLMMREGIRRCLNLARNWGRMMAWGFVDKFGRPLPKYSEKQLGRIMAGLPPGEDGEGRVEVVEDEVELVDQYGEPIMSVAEMLGKV